MQVPHAPPRRMVPDPSTLRQLPITARLLSPTEVESADASGITTAALRLAAEQIQERLLSASSEEQREAAVSPIGEDGKPRMLRMTAWIAHAGKPNRNGDAFLLADLEELVREGLFQAPNLGMVDFNHDFEAYGAWYSARLEYDVQAGEYGILAEGAIWAWRYESLANTLLAMQQRQGHIEVSMACLPRDIEQAEDENGRAYWVLRRPIFYTTSVLDVPPADKHARGLATENPTESALERERVLLAAERTSPAAERTSPAEQPPLAGATSQTASLTTDLENTMELENLLTEVRAALAESRSELVEHLTALGEAAARLPELTAELETASTALEAATARVAELEGTLSERDTALAEREVALAAAQGTLVSQEEELARFRAEEETRQAAEAEAARAERREARLAELSESARTALEAKDEASREKILDLWTDMEDEQWALHKSALNLAGKEGKYESKTRREGNLSGAAGDTPEGGFAIDKFFSK